MAAVKLFKIVGKRQLDSHKLNQPEQWYNNAVKNHGPTDRLNYRGDLAPIITRICSDFSLGKLRHFSAISVGYEDCNVVVETDNGKFLVKMFSKLRSDVDVQRYVSIMQAVALAHVRHPALIPNNEGKFLTRVQTISLVVMRFIEGKTYFELGRAPNEQERAAIIGEAVTINRVKHHPLYIFDSWAIPNIHTTYDHVKQFIQPNDLVLVQQTMRAYDSIDLKALPRCFVHGDLTKTNVLKGNDGQVYVLDFSVSGWYPRIQELAVIAANLLYEQTAEPSLQQTCARLAVDYEKLGPLTDAEHTSLFSYALAALAMEFLGAHQEKYINHHDTPETDFWLTLGRNGLRKELG